MTVEVAAGRDPVPQDGPWIFTRHTAIFPGEAEHFDDGKGHL